MRALDTGPWTELSFELGGERPRWEAGRPAWGRRPWLAVNEGENDAISTGSTILTLLEEALVWLDLEGALGEGVTMASDCGVFGEVCEAMTVILEKRTEFGIETGVPSDLNRLIGLRPLRIKGFES